MNICLVLGGGGGKGAYQIGVWEALKEMNIIRDIDTVIGTSVGALNAALFSQNNYEMAKNTWDKISNDKMFTIGGLGKNASVLSHDGLSSIIKMNLSEQSIKSSRIRCYVCATCTDMVETALSNSIATLTMDKFYNSIKGKVYSKYFCINDLDRDNMYKALLASAALPGAFGYVEIRGHRYRDGGIISECNLPYRKAIELGYKKIIAISLDVGVSRVEDVNGAKILFIHPSKNLGDLLNGTVDFSAEGSRWRMKLGYSDTIKLETDLKCLVGVNSSSALFPNQDEVSRLFY